MSHYKILKFNEYYLSLLVGILIFLVPYFDWDFLKILLFLISYCWFLWTLFSGSKINSLNFSGRKILPSENNYNLIFSFQLFLPLIYFSCLIALIKTSQTRFKNRSEGWQFYLILSISQLNSYWLVLQTVILSHVQKVSFNSQVLLLLLFFKPWMTVEFIKCLFGVFYSDHMVFLLWPIDVMNYVNRVLHIKLSYIPGINCT